MLMTFAYVTLSRHTSFTEAFEQADIFIFPYRSRRMPNEVISVNSVIINQGNPALGLPFEFFVENSKMSMKELHEIAEEILPDQKILGS